MDDIIALLAREAGKKFAEAQKQAALEAAKRNAVAPAPKAPAANAWARTAGKPGAGPPSAGKTAAPQPVAVAVAPPPQQPPRVAAPPPPTIDVEPFRLPGLAPEPPHPSVALLAAFGGGTSLLAGIVLAEALASPVSLRGAQLFDRLER